MQFVVILLFAGAFIALFLIKFLIEILMKKSDPAADDRDIKRSWNTEVFERKRSFSWDAWRKKHSAKPSKVAFAWAWMQCAGSFGYTYLRQDVDQPFPAIRGKEGECKILIRAEQAGNGRKGYDTVMHVDLPVSAGIGLFLGGGEELYVYEGSFQRDASTYFEDAKKDQLVFAVEKEAVFREHYYVPCKNFLLPKASLYQGFVLCDDFFEVRFAGVENDPQKMEALIDGFVDCCQFFSTLSEHTAGQSSVLPVTERSQLELKEPPQENIQAVPQEIVPEQEVISEPPVPEENIPEPQTVSPEISLLQADVIKSLWSSTFPGNTERELFETQYKGKSVRWEGILKSSFEYTYDFVFGQNKGIKGTVDLQEITPVNSSFPLKIRAQISFPPEEKDKLKDLVGKKIVFEGTLLKYEALSRELYLREGRLSAAPEEVQA